MQIKTNVTKFGGSVYLLLPKEIVNYLELVVGSESVIIEEKQKSKGRFAAFWKNDGKKK